MFICLTAKCNALQTYCVTEKQEFNFGVVYLIRHANDNNDALRRLDAITSTAGETAEQRRFELPCLVWPKIRILI